jgi:predicted nucleic acid-binding protein
MYLLRHVPGADQAILEDIRVGTYRLAHVLASRATDVAQLMKKYSDIPMSLADACLVDLATQVGSGRILTLDRDFKIYRWGRNRAFEMLIDL